MIMRNDAQKNNKPSRKLILAFFISFFVNLVAVIAFLFIMYELGFSTGTKKVVLILSIIIIFMIAICLHIAIIKKFRVCGNKKRVCVIYCIISLLGMCPRIWVITFSIIDLLLRKMLQYW